jgi:F-type H+-transporting ATPase subunit b
MLQAPNVSMLLILAIFFAVLWLLNRFVFRPVTAILDERERDSTTASQAYAEALSEFQAAADKIEADLSLARREALKLREERRAEGMQLRSQKIEQLKSETAEKLAGASAELEEHSRGGATDLPARVAALARLLAEKILGRKVAA